MGHLHQNLQVSLVKMQIPAPLTYLYNQTHQSLNAMAYKATSPDYTLMWKQNAVGFQNSLWWGKVGALEQTSGHFGNHTLQVFLTLPIYRTNSVPRYLLPLEHLKCCWNHRCECHRRPFLWIPDETEYLGKVSLIHS